MHDHNPKEHDVPPGRYASGGRALSAAPQRLEDSPDTAAGAHEVRNLIHELETHRIELEMQNRQLRESQALLEESRARYADLYDFAPVAYLSLDLSGRITDCNLTTSALLGLERARLIGRFLVSFMPDQ